MSVEVNITQPRKGPSPEEAAQAAPVTAPQTVDEDGSFESLLQAYEERAQTFSEGEVIKGKVIAITAAGVIVDV